jgi:hypothetical protein
MHKSANDSNISPQLRTLLALRRGAAVLGYAIEVAGGVRNYAVPGNNASLSLFRHRVLVCWWHSLRRRSQKRRINWTRMLDPAKHWLPNRLCSILSPMLALPLLIRDKNRMR